MKNQRKHGFRRALMLALGVFSLMSVEQSVHAQGTKYGTSARLAYPGGYYQQQQALTLIDQLRIIGLRDINKRITVNTQ